MSGVPSFPELSLRSRPELFDALLAYPFEEDVVEARFGDRRGWVIIHPAAARNLLRRRNLPKARTVASRRAAGGYPSLSGAHFHRSRSEVVVALAGASADTTAMATSLSDTVGLVAPSRHEAPAAFTRWMLHHLAGGDSTPIDLEVLIAGIAAATANAEAAQAGILPEPDVGETRAALARRLAERVNDGHTVFLAQLRERGWSTPRIVEELIGLALAGWASTAAAVATALTLGMDAAPTEAEISELLRLYPPSWLIVRELTGDETWGSAGELALVSPWLTHRSSAWRDPMRFDPARTDAVAALPFGAGPRRCPADLYARTQIRVALSAFGGGVPRPAYPALLGRRSAALVPDQEMTP
ncbi:cytochrome P450 [Agrococcus sp. UYP33]